MRQGNNQGEYQGPKHATSVLLAHSIT